MRAFIFVVLSAFAALMAEPSFAQAQDAQTTDPELLARKAYIQNLENNPSEEGLARRARNEAILKREGISIHSTLPVLPPAAETKRRTSEEVALRAVALFAVHAKADGAPDDIFNWIVSEYDLDEVFTEDEREFINTEKPDEFDEVQFWWRIESAQALLWSLGFYAELPLPTEMLDVDVAMDAILDSTKEEFLEAASLRSQSEILDAADMIYRCHWAVREREYVDDLNIGDLDRSVTMERHYALNWLFGYARQAWDDVSTDT